LRPRGPGEADFGLAAAWSPADQLRQLDQLRREGIITETEFEATKQELLAAMKAKAPAPPSAPFSTARTPAPPSPQTTSTETTAIPESTPAAHPSWITAPVSKP
jgi:hypothetical protein